MLSSKYKITSREFKDFYTSGKKKFSKNMRFQIVEDPTTTQPRFAVVVSKRIFKSAVKRNKQRRRIYNIVRETYPHFCKGFLCFIFIQKDISNISYVELKQEIQDILL